MNSVVKICIVVMVVILGGVAIIFNNNLDIDENINVVSESEREKTQQINNENINSDEEKNQISTKDTEKNINKSVTVFVSGEVKNPGVVTIDVNKRLADVVDKLGGFTENADLNRINLAMRIEDEKHYIIPKVGEDIEISMEENNEITSKVKSNLVNINEADIKELDT